MKSCPENCFSARTPPWTKLEAPQSQLLHLATHGCFQKGGCPKLRMEENTLLFADRKLNISDAALLGLEKVDSPSAPVKPQWKRTPTGKK